MNNDTFEKLGVFYLGQPYDLNSGNTTPGWCLYQSSDLVTHAVCVGMTGSGKTGLGITLIEEAAIDGIPVLAIDPKGDLANLFLSFPTLNANDLEPWVDAGEASKQGKSTHDFAEEQAQLWRDGLMRTGQGLERIAKLRQTADLALYTPGSTAAVPVSILKSFTAPSATMREDADLFKEKISSTATSVLSLAGIQADPLKSKEHVFLSNVISTAWQGGRDLDLVGLIKEIQKPSFTQIGAFDVESFYPANERFQLAMALNNLLAAPGFDIWFQGTALDIQEFLYSRSGKPKVSIISIAHLNDAERMFFVTLLLNELIVWMRSQSGTSSLRALFYMDEVFGYLPPVANPPSKAPFLTLLKQARAFGLGLTLSTQNPVDLDYKALSNAGTWFIGRLQTERDRDRLIDGLETASAGKSNLDRSQLTEIISKLSKRVFLLHNVHEERVQVFTTRWTLSYLRGPMTREELKKLCSGAVPPGSVQTDSQRPRQPASNSISQALSAVRPTLKPSIHQYFLPASDDVATYKPMIVALAQVRIADIKSKLEQLKNIALVADVHGDTISVVRWDSAEQVELTLSQLLENPQGQAKFEMPPPALTEPKNYSAWKKEFAEWLAANQGETIWHAEELDQYSQAGESERDFRIRLMQVAREQRDEALRTLRSRFSSRFTILEDRLLRAEQILEREQQQAQEVQIQSAISIGATIMGALMSKRPVGSRSLGRATTAARGTTRAIRQQQDVGRAEENIEHIRAQIKELEGEFNAEVNRLNAKLDPQQMTLSKRVIQPRKNGIAVQDVALAWIPYSSENARIVSPVKMDPKL